MPEEFNPDPEDILATTPKALEVRTIDGTPYPMLTPQQLTDDIVDRVIVWAASRAAATEDQLLLGAGAILHKISLDCLNSVGHRHDDEGNCLD